MTDDGRLELDGAGAVIDAGSHLAVDVVDLGDPAAGEQVPQTLLDSWMSTRVAPFARRHRGPVTAVAAGAAAVLIGVGWWTSRPPVVPPTVSLAVQNAVLARHDLSGPAVTAERLDVAYAARSLEVGARTEVLGLVGPGLANGDSAQPQPVADSADSRVVLSATIDCTDTTLADATSSSYGLRVRSTNADGDALEVVRPFDLATSDLSKAVLGHCLVAGADTALTVGPVHETPDVGTSIASMWLLVRNNTALPIVVSTARTPAVVEVDDSPRVEIAAGATGVVSSRLLVHDCLTNPALALLRDLPDPRGDPRSPGLAMRMEMGSASLVASYPTSSVDQVGAPLGTAVCHGVPSVRASLLDAVGGNRGDDTWEVVATFAVRTTGIGVTVGREHFTGGPAGAGSLLATGEQPDPTGTWVVSTAQLDGGAGRVQVTFSGASCATLTDVGPPKLPLSVTTANGSVYPVELPADDARLLAAASTACGVFPTSPSPNGWVTYAPS
jgi:hypothetical protein